MSKFVADTLITYRKNNIIDKLNITFYNNYY